MTAASCHSTNHHDRIPPFVFFCLYLPYFFLSFSVCGRETRSVTIRQESSKTRKDKSKGRMCLIVTASSHDSLFHLNFSTSSKQKKREKEKKKRKTTNVKVRDSHKVATCPTSTARQNPWTTMKSSIRTRHEVLHIDGLFLLAFAAQANGGAGEEDGRDQGETDTNPGNHVRPVESYHGPLKIHFRDSHQEAEHRDLKYFKYL